MSAVTSTTYKKLFNDIQNTQLGDSEGITWSNSDLIIAYNQAKNMLLGFRPDSNVKIAEIPLSNGSRQFIPADGLRLLDVVRNISKDGNLGQSIRQIDMACLDAYPDWHNLKGEVILEYMFDHRMPKFFYVYPSPIYFGDSGSRVEIIYSAMPNDITAENLEELLPFDSIYDQALIELMLYKLLSGDNEQGRNNSIHMQAAMGLLNIQSESASANDSASRGR